MVNWKLVWFGYNFIGLDFVWVDFRIWFCLDVKNFIWEKLNFCICLYFILVEYLGRFIGILGLGGWFRFVGVWVCIWNLCEGRVGLWVYRSRYFSWNYGFSISISCLIILVGDIEYLDR